MNFTEIAAQAEKLNQLIEARKNIINEPDRGSSTHDEALTTLARAIKQAIEYLADPS